MRSLGRALRKVGAAERRGPNGRRAELLFSSLPARGSLLERLGRMARRLSPLALPASRLPRRFGLFAAGGYLALWLAYGAVLGGHLPSVGEGVRSSVGYVAAQLGLGVERVHISGHQETRERDILDALDLGPSTSLITFDPYAAQSRLEDIAWVKTATVKKLLPSALEIDIVEREPYALWQIGGIVSVIDRTGATIGILQERRHARLPMVVGYGANRAAGELIEIISDHPRLAGRVRAAVRVAERRWNLRLDNGVEVRLPEHDPAGALAELVRLDQEQGLLARDIVSVDLRLDDRVVVRLSDSAAKQRKVETAGSAGRRGNT